MLGVRCRGWNWRLDACFICLSRGSQETQAKTLERLSLTCWAIGAGESYKLGDWSCVGVLG